MLSARHRLQKNAQVSRVLATGAKKKFGPLLIFTVPSDEPVKFAVAISKKVAKLAVRRNYLRRLILESIRTTLPLDQLTGEAVIVVLYYPTDPKAEIEQALKQWHAAPQSS